MHRSTQSSNPDACLSTKLGCRRVIAAYLPRQLQLRIETYLAPRHTILPVRSWASAASLIRERHVDLFFVDPTVEGTMDTDMIARLIAEFPSVAVVVYTTMTPATVSTVYKLAKQGLHQAILYGFDDTPERLALLLEDLPPQRFLPAVLAALQPSILQLPKLVQLRVQEALETPTRFRSVTQLAQSVNMSRAAFYLLFQQVGLGSPGRLLVGARLIQAYAYLLDPGVSVQAAGAKVGWDDQRTLKRYLRRAFGISVFHLRQQGPPGDLVERLVQWILAGEN